MAEQILVRLTLFLVAFFALQRLLPHLIAKPQRWHGLIALAVATLVAFTATALLLDESMAQSLIAWALITLAIAVIWTLRWKALDHERQLRALREQRDQVTAPDQRLEP
jgi:hypothetical protein